MHHTTANAQRVPGSQPHRHRVLNHMISMLLRSPFHRVISANLMLITFTGRRSGRSFTTPVTYTQTDNVVLFHSTQRWWRNLEGGAPVMLRLRGQRVSGYALPTQDVPTIVAALQAYLDAKGLRGAQMIDLPLVNPQCMPTEAELVAAATGRVLVTVTLTA